MNPFLWSSFEALCSFGEKLDPSKYFNLNQASNYYSTVDSKQQRNDDPIDWSTIKQETKFMSSSTNRNGGGGGGSHSNGFTVSDLFALKVVSDSSASSKALE